MAGVSLIIWGIYEICYGFIQTKTLTNFVFGLLVGFQVLAAFGLVVMIVARIHSRAAESETRVNQLERLLPICAYCKKIRDKDNNWHNIETYIEEKTTSQFSHGICPECLEKYFPEYAHKKRVNNNFSRM